MFNFLKQNKAVTTADKAAPDILLNKPSNPGIEAGADEIEDGLLDQVSGGINPQPLPPRSGCHHEFPIF